MEKGFPSENKNFISIHNMKGREMSQAPEPASLGCDFGDHVIKSSGGMPSKENGKQEMWTDGLPQKPLTGREFKYSTASVKLPNGEMTWSQRLLLESQRLDILADAALGLCRLCRPLRAAHIHKDKLQERMFWPHGLWAPRLPGDLKLRVKNQIRLPNSTLAFQIHHVS